MARLPGGFGSAGAIATAGRFLSCAWIDFNNDGYRDMFVVNGAGSTPRNGLYWNNGDGTLPQQRPRQI